MSNIGIKISQPGFDVKTATDNNLQIKSSYPALKIHSSGSGSVELTNNEGVAVLSEHNLGYKPFFMVWVDYGSGYKLTSCGLVNANEYTINYYGTTDTTQLELVAVTEFVGYIDPWDPEWVQPPLPGTVTVDYAWVIFYDPIL